MTDIQFGRMIRGRFPREENMVVRIVGQLRRAGLMSIEADAEP